MINTTTDRLEINLSLVGDPVGGNSPWCLPGYEGTRDEAILLLFLFMFMFIRTSTICSVVPRVLCFAGQSAVQLQDLSSFCMLLHMQQESRS